MRAGATTLGCHVIPTFTESCRGSRAGCKSLMFATYCGTHVLQGWGGFGVGPEVRSVGIEFCGSAI